MSSGTLPTQVDESFGRTETYSHGHGHRPDSSSYSLSTHHSHNRTGSHASNTGAGLQRDKATPSLDSLDGWTEETTAGGRSIITPGYDADNSPYTPPIKSERGHHARPSQSSYLSHHSHDHSQDYYHGRNHEHDHQHDHQHDHLTIDIKADRSLFTKTLLQYSAPFPILHAILVEKDSRRIFYFMT